MDESKIQTQDILSEIDNTQNKPSTIFSRLAFGCAVTNVVLFVAQVIIKLVLYGTADFSLLLKVMRLVVLFSTLGGFVFSIISLVRREKIKYLKTIAAIINIGLVGLMILSLVIALVINLSK